MEAVAVRYLTTRTVRNDNGSRWNILKFVAYLLLLRLYFFLRFWFFFSSLDDLEFYSLKVLLSVLSHVNIACYIDFVSSYLVLLIFITYFYFVVFPSICLLNCEWNGQCNCQSVYLIIDFIKCAKCEHETMSIILCTNIYDNILMLP